MPLIVFPFEVSPYEKPKVLVAQALIQALAVLAIYKYRLLIFKNLDRNLLIAIGAILALSLFHFFFLKTPTTFFGNIVRMQGVFLLWHLVALAVISSRFILVKIPAQVPIISASLLTLLAFILNKNVNNRAVATLGEPNALAATAIFIWPFIYNRDSKYAKILSILFVVVIILVSESRSALIALIIQLIFLAGVTRFNMSYAKASLLSLTLLSVSFVFPFFKNSLAFENRAEIWEISAKAGLQKPILGHGFGNAEKAIANFAKSFNYNNIRYQYIDSAHNFFLDWWIQGGLIGLTAITFLIIKGLLNLSQRGQTRELLALTGIITTMSFNPASVVTLVAFWWLMGQGFQVNEFAKK